MLEVRALGNLVLEKRLAVLGIALAAGIALAVVRTLFFNATAQKELCALGDR
jgi:hypothetical protein